MINKFQLEQENSKDFYEGINDDTLLVDGIRY